MSTAATGVPPLVARLVDDAALFPPGNAPMDRALAEHAAGRRSWYAGVVGPFLCPAGRVGKLRGALASTAGTGSAAPLEVALVADAGGTAGLAAGIADAAQTDRVRVGWVEVPLDQLPAGGAAALGVAVVVEVPRGPGMTDGLRAVAAAGPDVAVKFRTGGATAQAVPSTQELAAFVRGAVDLDLAFKLTAGLHHAVRRCDPATGQEQHGFLNVVVAVRAALLGAEVPELAAMLGEQDPQVLLAAVERMSDPDTAVVRSFFRSFGCCGVNDPVADLRALGLLPQIAPEVP